MAMLDLLRSTNSSASNPPCKLAFSHGIFATWHSHGECLPFRASESDAARNLVHAVAMPQYVHHLTLPGCCAGLVDAGLVVEQASEMRAQLDIQLRQAASVQGLESDDAALAHGQEVWARCEALTAGAGFFCACAWPFFASCHLWNFCQCIRQGSRS